jgi:hypothetical protein
MTNQKMMVMAGAGLLGSLALYAVTLPSQEEVPTTDVTMESGPEEPPTSNVPESTTTSSTTAVTTTTVPKTTSTTARRARAAAAPPTTRDPVLDAPGYKGSVIRDAKYPPTTSAGVPAGCLGHQMSEAEAHHCWDGLIGQYDWKGGTSKAFAVMMCESTGQSNAVGPKPRDGSGTPMGLFQVKRGSTDPVTNVRQANEMHKARGWQPWACA